MRKRQKIQLSKNMPYNWFETDIITLGERSSHKQVFALKLNSPAISPFLTPT